MLLYYIKQAYRNLMKNRLITIGSISTLLFGVLSISLLTTYVHSELTMDKFHKRHKDIYMTILQRNPKSNWEPTRINHDFWLENGEYPEIETVTSVARMPKRYYKLEYNNLKFSSEGFITDSNFFKVFDYKLLVGDIENVLADDNTILLTKNLAKRMFGDEDPLGKTIRLEIAPVYDYTVNGIIDNPPSNSSIIYDYIIADNSNKTYRFEADFILTNKGFNKDEFVKKTEGVARFHDQLTNSSHSVVALDDIYFKEWHKEFERIFSRTGDEKSLKILMIIIGIILIITVLNFSNLQVVNINAALKNIGINKISGAQGYHLFFLKLTEIIILICISTVIIGISYEAFLPIFNKIVGVSLSPNILYLVLLVAGTIGLIVMLAMIYPTVVILNLPISRSLKNQLTKGKNLIGRQAIIVGQLSLSIGLLIASIVVVKQLDMMLHKDLGFNTQNIIETRIINSIPISSRSRFMSVEEKKQSEEQAKNYQFVKNELASHSAIRSFTQLVTPFNTKPAAWKLQDGEDDFISQQMLYVDPGHINVFDFEMVEGRFFNSELDQESGSKVVINEAAKKYWGIDDISKAKLRTSISVATYNDEYEIIGVVKDFNFEHLSMKPRPLMMEYIESAAAPFLIRFNEGATQSGLQFVEELFHKINPDKPFEYTFVADEATALYQKEKRLSQIYVFFTLVAFLISMNGLFVIALYDTIKRTKEIGVRKVNGAKVSEVMLQLNRDFFKWVSVSLAIAIPATYYLMNKWLENFAYKTEISWWIFAIAGVLTLGIALLTVSWQSWRAATRNPVEALRYE